MYTELVNHLPSVEVVSDSALLEVVGCNQLPSRKDGRPFLILFSSDSERARATKLFETLACKTRTVLLRLSEINETNWQKISDELLETFAPLHIRQASLVSFAAAGSVAQNLALVSAKSIRALALVDASTRPNPSRFQRILDAVEQWLPMGLPFRSNFAGFDSRPFAQRIRAPVLVVGTDRSSPYLHSQAKLLTERLPTSWYFRLDGDNCEAQLCDLVLQFEEVPAKRPQ